MVMANVNSSSLHIQALSPTRIFVRLLTPILAARAGADLQSLHHIFYLLSTVLLQRRLTICLRLPVVGIYRNAPARMNCCMMLATCDTCADGPGFALLGPISLDPGLSSPSTILFQPSPLPQHLRSVPPRVACLLH